MLCYTCHEQRPMYTCSRCGETGHRGDFQKTHFEQDCARGTQQCLECKSGRRKGKVCIVEQCKQFIRNENLSQYHKHNPTRALVCEVCSEKGYTFANTETYTCASCKRVTGGQGLFQSRNLKRAAARGTQMCKACYNK